MPKPEHLLPAYESLARLIRSIVREEVAPIVVAMENLRASRGDERHRQSSPGDVDK
jgi:hypothetical protein